MNNKFEFPRRYLLGGLLFLSTLLCAQPISPVDDDNLGTFLDEMNQYFGDIMQVDEAQLLDFLDPFVTPANTGSTCSEPLPTVTSEDASQITFDWAGNSGAGYRVGYLNLLTGQRGTLITTNTSHSFGLQDGLYVFAFKQICGNFLSPATIIIYDKVVGLTANDGLPCNCRHIWTMEGNLQGFEIQVLDEFDLMIQLGQTVHHQMHFKKDCLNCTEFTYNPDCLGSGQVVNAQNVDYLGDDIDNVATIAFTGENLALQLNLTQGYQAIIGVCQSRTMDASHPNRSPLRITPSGGQRYRIAKTRGSETVSGGEIILLNPSGQRLRQWTYSAEGGYETDIDLSAYPAGMYYLQCLEHGNTWTERLVNLR